MEKLSKTDETRVLVALENAIDSVNRGTAPNDAIRKVAEAQQFSPQIVQRMVEAFNVSKTLSHMKSASGSERAASFPLADATAILSVMYPEKVLTSAERKCAEYRPAGVTEREDFMTVRRDVKLPTSKVAAYPTDPQMEAHRQFNRRDALRKEAEVERSAYRTRHMRAWGLAEKAAEYFRYVDHEPFETVEKKAMAAYGPIGKSCMDLIYSVGGLREKRAKEAPTQQLIFDRTREPYRIIEQLYKAAQEVTTSAEAVIRAEEKLAAFEKKGQFKPVEPESLLDSVLVEGSNRPFEKAAIPLDFDLTNIATQAAMGAFGLKDPSSKGTLESRTLANVLDPGHEAEMRAAKTKVMLNDFLVNDPILSGYDPGEVSDAYNQIAQLTPEVANQPAVMRGLLRRVLQQGGVMEPFEAHQTSQIESQLKRLSNAAPVGAGGAQ